MPDLSRAAWKLALALAGGIPDWPQLRAIVGASVPFQWRIFDSVETAPWPHGWMSTAVIRPLIVSASMLSQEHPTLRTDGAIFASASRSVYGTDAYCDPRSVWCTFDPVRACVDEWLVQSTEGKSGSGRTTDTPPNDANDEGYMNKALSCRSIGKPLIQSTFRAGAWNWEFSIVQWVWQLYRGGFGFLPRIAPGNAARLFGKMDFTGALGEITFVDSLFGASA